MSVYVMDDYRWDVYSKIMRYVNQSLALKTNRPRVRTHLPTSPSARDLQDRFRIGCRWTWKWRGTANDDQIIIAQSWKAMSAKGLDCLVSRKPRASPGWCDFSMLPSSRHSLFWRHFWDGSTFLCRLHASVHDTFWVVTTTLQTGVNACALH